MPIDITARPAAGRQIIERYGDGGFTVSGVRHNGSVLIFRDRTLPWPIREAADIDAASLQAALAAETRPRILVVGCGRSFVPRPPGLDEAMRQAGTGVEWMDTGAACRTYNVLLLEEREVAAAIIAIE
jgi:uncharacterized protein